MLVSTRKPKNLKMTLLLLFLVVLIDQASVLVVVPVMPSLLHELTGRSAEQNALWGGAFIAVFGLMRFLFGPRWAP